MRETVHCQIFEHLNPVGDTTVLLGSTIALLGELLEVVLWGLVTNGDIDLTLGQDEVSDLVVSSLLKPLLLQVVSRVDVVDVAAVKEQVTAGYVTREEAPVTQLDLGSLVYGEVWAG